MQDGKGALYFINPILECSANYPGPAKPFMKPQATQMTAQELREFSPSGEVDMDSWLGRKPVVIGMKALLAVCLIGLTVNCFI